MSLSMCIHAHHVARRWFITDKTKKVDRASACLCIKETIIINLINNALDAMPDGGELDVKTSEDDAHLIVEVADNGIGMTEEIKARIFEPLYTTKQRGHGTGLGLVVVRQILQEHNAEISAETEKNKGTRFVLTFPKD